MSAAKKGADAVGMTDDLQTGHSQFNGLAASVAKPNHDPYLAGRDQAIWLKVLRKRISENENSRPPMAASQRNCGQTTLKPAPR